MAVDHLFGRERELGEIRAFLDAPPMPAALLLEGEAGIGKTALWQAAIGTARERGFRVLISRAAEREGSLAYAGLSDLLSPVIDEVSDSLPSPQQRAIDAALLRSEASGSTPDRRAVSTAAFVALKALSQHGPLAIAIDDVHWLDEASSLVLDFALRRLSNEPAVVIATSRPIDDRSVFDVARSLVGGPTIHLMVGPLDTGDLARILARERVGSLSRSTLRRTAEAAMGNPLIALELERAVIRHGGDLRPGDPLPVPADLGSLLDARLADLPAEAIDVVLLVAAAGEATRSTLLDAGGVEAARGLAAAIDAGVLDDDGERIRAAHPLFAEAAYGRAAPSRAPVGPR